MCSPPPPIIDDSTHYIYTLLLTNPNTADGGSSYGGLLVEQIDKNVKIIQQEDGFLKIMNDNAVIEMTPNGVGVGAVCGGYLFNVDGYARFVQTVKMQSGLTVDGMLKVGNGFHCDSQGNMKVKHLKVTLTDWPDYVFGSGYALMPLGELESYIREHDHLPGVPTANNVEKNGADLGEMNKILMEKVEELTLYIIDLQKQINGLKSNK